MHNRKPEWLRIKIRNNPNLTDVTNTLKRLSLHTVCDEAGCPNKMECFSKKTATFMILGSRCTRNCTFCNVEHNTPSQVDQLEPHHVAEAVREMGLKHVVITSVTRDDLDDGGSHHFAETIKAVRALNNITTIEVLIPDFKGVHEQLDVVIRANPDIINHNVETVPRLYGEARPQAIYERSLELLKRIKSSGPGSKGSRIFSKSGLMLGLGETESEVLKLLEDLKNAECDIITIGQYLAPSVRHHPVIEYIHPEKFEFYRIKALEMGFLNVASAPLVRSSYLAESVYNECLKKNQAVLP
ncbi:MAG: lipoyl synthase [Spirochaetales bacterium]|nr:lipoyl synthase [Spirochaetales bacterium]